MKKMIIGIVISLIVGVVIGMVLVSVFGVVEYPKFVLTGNSIAFFWSEPNTLDIKTYGDLFASIIMNH